MAFLPSDAKKQRLLLVGVLPLLAAGAYWYFVQQDQAQKLEAEQSRLEQLQTKNAAASALAAKGGPELKKKLAVYEEHLNTLERLVPKSEEVPDLLHDITMRAEESGVELNLLRPEKSLTADFYVRQSYAMSVVGPYASIGRFLSAVGSLPRVVVPLRMKLVPRVDKDRQGNQRLQADFQIQTFVAPEPGQLVADTAKGKPRNART